MHESELLFLEVLLEATEKGLITWRVIEDDDRDLFQAIVDGEIVEVELVYFKAATGGTSEQLIAIVSGLKTHLHAAVGTPAYDIVSKMLSNNIFGWDQGRASAIKGLEKATDRIRSFLKEG